MPARITQKQGSKWNLEASIDLDILVDITDIDRIKKSHLSHLPNVRRMIPLS